jgi:hypothetical protein
MNLKQLGLVSWVFWSVCIDNYVAIFLKLGLVGYDGLDVDSIHWMATPLDVPKALTCLLVAIPFALVTVAAWVVIRKVWKSLA